MTRLRNQEIGSGGLLLDTYVATQSATTAHGYDQARPELVTSSLINTPNLHAQYPVGPEVQTEPYYFRIDSIALDIVNFYNAEDSALSGWELAKYVKPLFPYGWSYLPDGSGGQTAEEEWYRGTIITETEPGYYDSFNGEILSLPGNRYEIIAMAADSHSKALGGAVYDGYNVGGPINEGRNVDLNGQFGFADDHSAQFLSNNINRRDYWLEMLRIFNLTLN